MNHMTHVDARAVKFMTLTVEEFDQDAYDQSPGYEATRYAEAQAADEEAAVLAEAEERAGVDDEVAPQGATGLSQLEAGVQEELRRLDVELLDDVRLLVDMPQDQQNQQSSPQPQQSQPPPPSQQPEEY